MPGQVRDVDVRQPRRELGDVDAANAERVGGVGAEVRLERERDRLRVADPQLVDEARRQHSRIVEAGAVRRQPRVLDAGDERAEIEARGGVRGRRQAAGGLALRRVELELAPVEADEERILVRDLVVDRVRRTRCRWRRGSRSTCSCRSCPTRSAAGRCSRRSSDGVDPVLRDDVVRETGRAGTAGCVALTGRLGIEVRIQPGRERIVDRRSGCRSCRGNR